MGAHANTTLRRGARKRCEACHYTKLAGFWKRRSDPTRQRVDQGNACVGRSIPFWRRPWCLVDRV